MFKPRCKQIITEHNIAKAASACLTRKKRQTEQKTREILSYYLTQLTTQDQCLHSNTWHNIISLTGYMGANSTGAGVKMPQYPQHNQQGKCIILSR